ncbi:uncharacterized protein RCC_09938 [Ramularia collo-cygni]|uniref:Uncharacterized protein n=1 Tax=Ramularia collo-cygni TaxID=112498 RepID=A0A2D3VB81_9PEZI|nr:uncharacterized protein RCC_09938 [Ramularia collo-cygni]CZT24220.1 uncharacterized protein RCC_09938 [Ramularia collo-cygni]
MRNNREMRDALKVTQYSDTSSDGEEDGQSAASNQSGTNSFEAAGGEIRATPTVTSSPNLSLQTAPETAIMQPTASASTSSRIPTGAAPPPLPQLSTSAMTSPAHAAPVPPSKDAALAQSDVQSSPPQAPLAVSSSVAAATQPGTSPPAVGNDQIIINLGMEFYHGAQPITHHVATVRDYVKNHRIVWNTTRTRKVFAANDPSDLYPNTEFNTFGRLRATSVLMPFYRDLRILDREGWPAMCAEWMADGARHRYEASLSGARYQVVPIVRPPPANYDYNVDLLPSMFPGMAPATIFRPLTKDNRPRRNKAATKAEPRTKKKQRRGSNDSQLTEVSDDEIKKLGEEIARMGQGSSHQSMPTVAPRDPRLVPIDIDRTNTAPVLDFWSQFPLTTDNMGPRNQIPQFRSGRKYDPITDQWYFRGSFYALREGSPGNVVRELVQPHTHANPDPPAPVGPQRTVPLLLNASTTTGMEGDPIVLDSPSDSDPDNALGSGDDGDGDWHPDDLGEAMDES